MQITLFARLQNKQRALGKRKKKGNDRLTNKSF